MLRAQPIRNLILLSRESKFISLLCQPYWKLRQIPISIQLGVRLHLPMIEEAVYEPVMTAQNSLLTQYSACFLFWQCQP